ncbi:polymorphic toxin-type HINT domain-containing protein [Lacipirellula sp.]|uniref:polymorphic toxin-type HINT domain-containing protein n=1 Tax=Lacipirellula sp. TaxID=2691419 RepID=UPI003D0C46B5
MARSKSVVLCACLALGSIAPLDWEPAPQLVAAEIKPQLADSPKNASKLVEQAISAGLTGNAAERGILLKRAAEADPDYAPAKWQRGLVNFEGAWRTPEEVASHISADKRWQEYDSLRAEAKDTPADHLRLAQWSMRQGLTAEERYHWANVLAANPGHAQARQRLGAQEYQGMLFTREQVAAEKARLEQAKRDATKFKPQLALWCKNATSELKATREKGLAKIRAIDDVAAIPALRDAVSRTIGTAGGKEHRSELVLAMTAALAGIPEHPATLALTELSVFSSLPEVRLAAAEALRSRPPTDFVPLLMATLEAPIEAEVDVMAAPDGTVRFVETLTQQQQTHIAAQVRSVNFEVTGALGRGRMNTGVALNRNLNATSRRVETTQQQLDELNAASAERNARVIQVLKKVLDEEPSKEDVTAWWQSWQNYNELSYGAINKVVETRLDETYVTKLEPPCECFAPGTLVWRQSGPTPIEQVRVGDMVLAQHPSTGELAYRPVLETTVGPLARVMKLKLPNEEFISTLGHRFWVDGSGWAMAKELQLPASLHTLQGTAKIEELALDGELECHNLVVDDFHTFVVGKSQLVVHDKTCPQPTLALSPGFVPKPGVARDMAKSFTGVSP